MTNRLGVFRRWFPTLIVGIFFILSACVQSNSAADDIGIIANQAGLVNETAPAQIGTDALNDYETVMAVLTHPRCMNCHPTDNFPRQRDEQIDHLFNVERGDADHGGPVQKCQTCHHEENNPYSDVPGAPHWGLAPHSMGWLGLSDTQVAETLLDPTMNGGRSHEDLLHHMSEDPLVLWAWDPGDGRSPIPIPHEEFVTALESWLAAGAPIPATID